jgi:hypothetical protein
MLIKFGKNIYTIKKDIEAPSEASREVGLEVNTEKMKSMVTFHHQYAEQNHNLLIANKSSENVAKLKYFGTILTNRSCSYKEIKSKLNSGNACNHPVQNILSLHLLS